MVIESLECNYKCGTQFTLAFHYKIEHEDAMIECARGDEALSAICIGATDQGKCFKMFSFWV